MTYFVRVSLVLLTGWWTAAPSQLRAQELLTNGGFETGNFNGWTVAGPYIGHGGGHSGSYSVYCGSGLWDNGMVGDLFSQTVTTTPGTSYDLSIWVLGTGGGAAEVYLNWDGVRVLDIDNTDFPTWTNLHLTLSASTTQTTFAFGSRNQPAAYYFDDASVMIAVVPEPSSTLLVVSGFLTMAACRRRSKT